jgi:hypothetical protein
MQDEYSAVFGCQNGSFPFKYCVPLRNYRVLRLIFTRVRCIALDRQK